MFTWLQRDTFSLKSNLLPSFWLLFVVVLKVNTIKRENSKSLKAQLSVDVFLLRLLGLLLWILFTIEHHNCSTHQNSFATAFCSAVGGERTFTSQRPPFQGSFAILSSLNATVIIFSPVSEKTVLCPESSVITSYRDSGCTT